MTLSKCKYIFCLIAITCILLLNVSAVSREPYREFYDTNFKTPYLQIYNVSLAYSLYFYNIFPVVLMPILNYCAQSKDYTFPSADSPFYHGKEKIDIKNYQKEDFYIYPAYSDLGMIFVIYLVSMLKGQFLPIGARMFNIVIFLAILLFFFNRFRRIQMTLVGLLICSLLASHRLFISHLYYYAFTGWGYSLLGALLIFAILLPIVINKPLPEASFWLKIVLAGIAFFVFLAIRSDLIFISLSILFFVLIYGNTPLAKRITRFIITALILVTPYFIYSNSITGLRQYYHKKFQLPATQENYSGAHHIIWHGVYCGLGDFGSDKGFKWLDSDALRFANTVKPGIGIEDKEYEIILRKKVMSTISKNPLWYMKILILRTKQIFFVEVPYTLFGFWVATKVRWISWAFIVSLLVFIFLAILLKKYKELKMYLFFIPSIFTGIFITVAAGARYYYGVLVLYYLPSIFIISFILQGIIDRFIKLRFRHA